MASKIKSESGVKDIHVLQPKHSTLLSESLSPALPGWASRMSYLHRQCLLSHSHSFLSQSVSQFSCSVVSDSL